MKRIITIIIAILLISSIGIAQDTLYLYKSGVIVAKHAVVDIDSAIFYRPTTIQQVGTVTDNDGNVYNTISIGTQIWMVENLRTTTYNDGTSIPLVANTSWSSLTTPAYCSYNNTINTDTINTYGRLYNWYAVNTNKLCPLGYHVPTDDEWTFLSGYLGGNVVAGGKLKEIGTIHWDSPNSSATNETGFTALPNGVRGDIFNWIGNASYWWSSTEYYTYAYSRSISYGFSNIYRSYPTKSIGEAVRCLKNN